jgi:hypothetical protein
MGDQKLIISSSFVLHLQFLVPTKPHETRVVGYDPFSLWVIHKEGLCPSSGHINRLMMMMMKTHILGRVQTAQNQQRLLCKKRQLHSRFSAPTVI